MASGDVLTSREREAEEYQKPDAESRFNEEPGGAAYDEEKGDSGSESDTESLLHDILNGELIDERSHGEDDIPKAEALRLRNRLREIGPNQFILENLTSGLYTAKRLLTAFDVHPPEFWDSRRDSGYYQLLGAALLRDINTRHKLPQYNTLHDAVDLLKSCKNIMVITGAGISTNLGVPDFRSKDTGFYDQMRHKGFDSPEDIFNFETFHTDPTIFYYNSSATLPEPSKSTPTHAFVKLLSDQGKLLTNYTQNIDNIEGNVGIPADKLIQCHGSWATFTCTRCFHQVPGSRYYDDVKAKRVPTCSACRPPPKPPLKRKRSSQPASRSQSRHGRYPDDDDDDADYGTPGSSRGEDFEPGIMKPDITFFGEKLPSTFFQRFKERDVHAVDLIVVIGTSMSVSPVSEIPMAVSEEVPQIMISRERVRHVNFDVTLLGDCDVITEELARRAGWRLEHPTCKGGSVEVGVVDEEMAVWSVKRRQTMETGNESSGVVGGQREGDTYAPQRERREEQSPAPERT